MVFRLAEQSNVMPRVILTTSLALLGFAANSILCRLALDSRAIDAASFTAIRLLSAALALNLILAVRSHHQTAPNKGRWLSGFMLFAYATGFSFAYDSLSTGTGALILFGTVQVTMILAGYLMGHRPAGWQWCGLLLAVAGFVFLVFPGANAPSFSGFLLMAIAGCAWGGYSLLGRTSTKALAETAGNFWKSLPLAGLLLIAGWQSTQVSGFGISLAVLSGAFATGMIYVVWYTALTSLTAVQAAVVQLLVPVIAALGGVVFLSEAVTYRLVLASGMILGGVLMVLLTKAKS